MHNSPLKNKEFQLSFTENNLRYVLGEKPINQELVNRIENQIKTIKEEIEELNK